MEDAPSAIAMRRAARVAVLALCACACAPAVRSEGPRSGGGGAPLWGELAPGAFDVGFEQRVLRDPTRVLGGGAGAPGKILRPVFVDLWYPAPRDAAGAAIPYGRYVAWDIAGDDLAAIKRQLDQHGRSVLADEVAGAPWHRLDRAGRERVERVLAMPTAARERAAHAGAAPLVIYHHGAQATADEGSILAEYLASHGHVVASVFAVSATEPAVARGAATDDEFGDIALVIQALHREPWVDASRLALVGHSLGAQYALVFAAAHPAVDAVVSFDTTWDYPYSPRFQEHNELYKSFLATAPALTTPVLAFASGEPDYAVFAHAERAARIYVTMTDLDHDDFLSQRAIAARVPAAGAAPDAGAATYLARYQQLCELTRLFLDVQLRGGARDALSRLPTPAQAALGIDVRAQPATRRPPPRLRDLRDLAAREGPAAAIRRCSALGAPPDGCADGWELDVADALLEEGRVDLAVALLDAHVAAHPDRTPGLLALALALERAGDRDRAIRAYRQVLAAIPALDRPVTELSRDELGAYVRRRDAEAGLSRLGGSP